LARRRNRRIVVTWVAEIVSAETDIHSGTEFIGYRLEQLIGQGGMGVVYRAYDRRLKRTVAIKFIAPKLALDARFRERFLRETELAASFEHPNAVPIYDAGEVDGRLYLAMRYVEGSDLATLLRSEAPLDPGRTIRICGQVAGALDAAHASGIVHRDVKPSNVLLDAAEHVYLADFGLTRRLVDEENPLLDGSSLGTPAYVAPEQLEGDPADARSDLYSLACLLYECLTGKPPFQRDSHLAVTWAHLEEEPPHASAHNSALPASVDDPLRTALAKDPADRPPSCAALIAALETALGLSAPRRSRRRTLLFVAGAALLAGLAAVLTAVFAGSNGHASRGPLYGKPNTLLRIDPKRNAVADVIPLGLRGAVPEAVAVHGRRVWVYSSLDGAVSRVDESTKNVQATPVPVGPVDLSQYAGPVLAADAGGAWLIGLNWNSNPGLVRIPETGRPDFHPLDVVPWGVASGYGAVWVVAHGKRDSQLLRIDPATARITHRTRFSGRAAIDSVATGYGYVWVVGASSSRLYRIDARTGERRGGVRHVETGHARAPRPVALRRRVSVGLSFFWPRTLALWRLSYTTSPDEAEVVGAFKSGWVLDAPRGKVFRYGWGVIKATIRAVAEAPAQDGPCLSAIAASAESIWVTVAPSYGGACRP
jgi:serine/threonine protein kinase